MGVIQAAENREEIMSAMNIHCPLCSERQYASFDKLYTTAYDKCVMCTDDDTELTRNGDNIFAIIEA